MDRAKLDALISLVNERVAGHGFNCIEAEWLADTATLRLYVDRVNGSIDLDGCVAVNNLLEENSGIESLIRGSYSLEVSSPGVERPLRSKAELKKHVGQVVEVKLQDKQDDRKHGQGKLVEAGDQIVIETVRGNWTFPFEKLLKARLVYDWSRMPKAESELVDNVALEGVESVEP